MTSVAQLRRRLLRQHGAKNEEHLQKLVGETVRVENLRREHEQLEHDLSAAIGSRWSSGFSRHILGLSAEAGTPTSVTPRAAVQELLEGPAAASLPTIRDDLRGRLAAIEKDIHQRIEVRGRIAAQVAALVDDRQLAARQLEMATIQQRIDDAIGRWQVLAVTGRMLETIRALYETDRQPETLREASGYFQQMTQGKYRRVWTPVGDRVLRVEDAEGQGLAVEMLSRGAREQLFLSLRLALAAHFARRGATLPLILDDVLVNFDTDRARAAAQVLRDFAALGTRCSSSPATTTSPRSSAASRRRCANCRATPSTIRRRWCLTASRRSRASPLAPRRFRGSREGHGCRKSKSRRWSPTSRRPSSRNPSFLSQSRPGNRPSHATPRSWSRWAKCGKRSKSQMPTPTRDELASRYLDQLPFAPYPVQEDALLAWFTAEQGVLVCTRPAPARR